MTDERIHRKATKRGENDPAWLYVLLGIVCLGAAILYALYGDHAPHPSTNFYGQPNNRTPQGTFLVVFGSGIGLFFWGLRKMLRSGDK